MKVLRMRQGSLGCDASAGRRRSTGCSGVPGRPRAVSATAMWVPLAVIFTNTPPVLNCMWILPGVDPTTPWT